MITFNTECVPAGEEIAFLDYKPLMFFKYQFPLKN